MDRHPESPDRRRVLKGAAAVTAAAATASCARRQVESAADRPTADEIIELLQLAPNATCGFVRVTFTSKLSVAAGGLPAPFADGRALGSALYFLVTPHAPVRPHRIKNDQIYHYYLGSPLEVFLLHSGGNAERVVVGPDIRSGQRVQLLIPGNTFHTARLLGGGDWFLGASTEWPAVVPTEDVEIGNVDKLAAEYPSVAQQIRSIVASVRVQAATGGPR